MKAMLTRKGASSQSQTRLDQQCWGSRGRVYRGWQCSHKVLTLSTGQKNCPRSSHGCGWRRRQCSGADRDEKMSLCTNRRKYLAAESVARLAPAFAALHGFGPCVTSRARGQSLRKPSQLTHQGLDHGQGSRTIQSSAGTLSIHLPRYSHGLQQNDAMAGAGHLCPERRTAENP